MRIRELIFFLVINNFSNLLLFLEIAHDFREKVENKVCKVKLYEMTKDKSLHLAMCETHSSQRLVHYIVTRVGLWSLIWQTGEALLGIVPIGCSRFYSGFYIIWEITEEVDACAQLEFID